MAKQFLFVALCSLLIVAAVSIPGGHAARSRRDLTHPQDDENDNDDEFDSSPNAGILAESVFKFISRIRPLHDLNIFLLLFQEKQSSFRRSRQCAIHVRRPRRQKIFALVIENCISVS
jgi:hypothetical protein